MFTFCCAALVSGARPLWQARRLKSARHAATGSRQPGSASVAAALAEKLYLDYVSQVVHHLAVGKVVAPGALYRTGERRVGLLSGYRGIRHFYGTLVNACHGIDRLSN